MNLLCRWVIRRAGWIVLGGMLATVVLGFFATRLFKDLRTEIEELLPREARSVQDLGEVSRRLRSIDYIGILVFSEHPSDSKRFVDALAARLEKLPGGVSAGVEYRITRELKFFEKRTALYLELPDLRAIRDYIRRRIAYEREIRNPLNLVNGRTLVEPRFDFAAVEARYRSRTTAFDHFPDGGYYATVDGKKRVILVNLPGEAHDVPGMKRLRAAVLEAVRAVDPARFNPDIQVRYTGGVEQTLDEHRALIADLELSTIVVTLLVSLAMAVYFRAIRVTVILVAGVFMGTLWTFGLGYFLVGYLNANSAFLGSIVLGNGINFGIIFLARYLEERRGRHRHARAIYIAVRRTIAATGAAALAAAFSYGSLILTSFRGFRQFGILGLTGMILCWVSAYTVLPAMLTIGDGWRPLVPPDAHGPRGRVAALVAAGVSRHFRWITAVSLMLCVFSVVFIAEKEPWSNPDLFETNLARLRDKTSMKRGSAYLSRHLDEVFRRHLTPTAFLPKSPADAEALAAKLREEMKTQPESFHLIESVQTLRDFLPRDQAKKIEVLREIRALLPEHVLARIPAEDRRKVRHFLDPAVFKPIEARALPGLVLSKFMEKDGTLGNLVVVQPKLTSETQQGPVLIRFIGDLRRIADSVRPGTPLASSQAVTADLLEAVSRDGPRATLFAFSAVLFLVLVLFRGGAATWHVLFSLLLGLFWMGAAAIAIGVKINFLNFIALPITFGIGVDYGVNIFQRYRHEGRAGVAAVIRNTGGAVALCSLTTTIGYGSLLLAGSRAFVSFGLLAVLGELTCITAAVFAYPAVILFWGSIRKLPPRRGLLKPVRQG